MKAALDGAQVHAIVGAKKVLTIEFNTNSSIQVSIFWMWLQLTDEFFINLSKGLQQVSCATFSYGLFFTYGH